MAILGAEPAQATLLTFNSDVPSDNVTVRQDWLNTIGVASPQFLVDFETGFVDNQNISGVAALFPGGLIITDTSVANQAFIESGSIGGSNPVGGFAVRQNELKFLELDFSADPVDYVAFQDIDQNGTTGIVTFVGGGTVNISFETTGGSGDTAEFFGIFRNDQPRITLVQLNASGDGTWGIDNIEYGTDAPIPEPATMLLLGSGLVGIAGFSRRRKPH